MKIWIYKHYKWNLYEVIGVWHHTETLEELVFYRALYNSPEFWENALWCRPKEMFLWNLEVDWVIKQRFEYVWNN